VAQDFQRIHTGPVILKGMADGLVQPNDIARRINNFYQTRQGSLRSCWGPVEYHPREWLDDGGGSTVPGDTDYEAYNTHGVFHTMVGARSILLRHQGQWVFEHNGATKDWDVLVGPTALSGNLWVDESLRELDDGRPRFLTQFVSTPDGVLIVPQEGRAYFYDGVVLLPFGYDNRPGAPTPVGPRPGYKDEGDASASDYADSANTEGYAHNGRLDNRIMGSSRLGSIDNQALALDQTTKRANALGGVLQAGEWVAAVQWVDYWGNLSPIGGLSSPLRCTREDNLSKDRKGDEDESSDRLRIQGAWTDVSAGRDGTVGRIILRSKDRLSSGIAGLYELPLNAGQGQLAFASMPDNVCTMMPDNIPDSWLLLPAKKVDPMPVFRVAAQAFGRMWIGNFSEQPGAVQASYPGKWGTLDPETRLFPDANGKEVTGLHSCDSGLLIFTRTSTFLVTLNDSGEGFRVQTLHSSLGCASPDSVATMPSGLVIWLSDTGFVAFDGRDVKDVGLPIREDTARINRAWDLRACAAVDEEAREYRCWVPVDQATVNNLCFVFDGASWRQNDYLRAEAVCVTRDTRKYTLALGYVRCDRSDPGDALGDFTDTWSKSLWVVDHDGLGILQPNVDTRIALIETAWLKMNRSHSRSSPKRVELWLRETGSGNLTLEVYRDGRDSPAIHTISNIKREPKDDIHEKWGATELGGSVIDPMLPKGSQSRPAAWNSRRPFWSKVSVQVPNCETFKLKLYGTGDWDFLGFRFAENGGHKGGATLPGVG
jgi:hypothetical protein